MPYISFPLRPENGIEISEHPPAGGRLIVVVVVATLDWLFTLGIDENEMQIAAMKRNEANVPVLILSIF